MIPRKAPLRRKAWLKRQSQPIKRRGRPRFRGYVRNMPYRLWVRQQGCQVAGPECFGIIEFAHVVSRARGGEDEGNGCGLCSRHHAEQHRGHRTFDAKYGISCADIAARLWTEYEQQEAW